MEINILNAGEVSVNDYRNLRLRALKEEPQAYGSSYEEQKQVSDGQWQDWLENYKKEKGNWMVFASNGLKLIGMTGAYQREDDKKENSALIIAVYVVPEARRQGVSKLLMQEILNKLIAANIVKAKLYVNVEQDAAVNLYTGFGFKTVKKERMEQGDGKLHDELLMEKQLSKD